MFAQIKKYVEHPAVRQSGFAIDRILHMNIDCHRLRLTRVFSYIKLPAWISAKKVIINSKNENDKECFRWSVNAALLHEEIGAHPERISKLLRFEDRYNWGRLKFLLAISKISSFEKDNSDIVVNILFITKRSITKKNIDTLRRRTTPA